MNCPLINFINKAAEFLFIFLALIVFVLLVCHLCKYLFKSNFVFSE